ncbi:Midasin, partial [Armadillidium nasatum]
TGFLSVPIGINFKMDETKKVVNFENLGVDVLDSKYREYLRNSSNSTLLEILVPIRNLIGNFESNKYNLDAHAAFSVCLGNINNDDICKFTQQYFQMAPSPFYSLTQITKDPDCKKLKLMYACNCITHFVQMSESEMSQFLSKFVSLDFHTKMITDKCLLTINPLRNSIAWSSSRSLEYMCKIGRILLPLHKKIDVKNSSELMVNENLPSTLKNLESIALGISSNKPVLVEGLVGSGKTSLIAHVAALTGRRKAPEIIKIQLSDQTDSKTLIGTYRCTANPGEFIWQAGSVTQAVTEGYWLLLEDIDFAPLDVISMLIPLLDSRCLPVPGHGNIKAHPNFQVFCTRRLLPAGCRLRIGSSNLIENLWTKITLSTLSPDELKQLICEKWTLLKPIAEKLVEVYMVLSSGQHGEGEKSKICDKCGASNLTSAKTSGRFVTVRDLIKWCSRISVIMEEMSQVDLHSRAFEEALDCFCYAVPDEKERYTFSLHIGSHLNINEAMVSYYANNYKPEVILKDSCFKVGSRGSINRLKKSHIGLSEKENATFSKTRLSSCMLERVTVAVMNEEPVLLVGETGTGKTSIVQYLAEQTNHHLCVINMNQQSDSSDLLGGFKPVEIRTVVAPLKSDFEILFASTFSTKKNSKFLNHIMLTYSRQKWDQFFALMGHSKVKGIEKLSEELKELNKSKDKKKWKEFQFKLDTVKDQIQKVKSSLAFAYIEGTLVKAVQEGKWVLLDEINLASADTLECLSGLLESSNGSLMLHERGDSKPIKRHSDFRLFACMNPATDVGKKELPVGLRNRFTEFFVDEIQDTEDLKQIVYEYLRGQNPSTKLITGIVKLYINIKKLSETSLTDATGHKPHFSLRTLCRTLIVARKIPCQNFIRSLYEAFSLSFLTQLDKQSYQKVTEIIQDTFKAVKKVSIPCPGTEREYVNAEGFWIPVGGKEPEIPEKYILTNTVRGNLKDLARIVSIGRFPVLLQGDTSVGKTSLITYLAKLTGNHCVRINNHQHTDLQEYVGSYAPDQNGKLIFKEEIETTVKAHPKFMLFATQNPPGLYGGRQVLSRAFRNRFVELHFDAIPPLELQTILKERCDIPESLSKKMVLVLQDLQNRRRTSSVFQGKQSFITLRDLFRWAERYRLSSKIDGLYDWDQHMADEGYLVLAGKIRIEEEVDAIMKVLKHRLKREVKIEHLFTLGPETSLVTKPILEKLENIEEFEHIVWTLDMRRLYVLISKALSFCEPVLLVGDTGCGKTTVCQMIASVKKQKLYTINCHMHTEGADFLGGLRPVRDRTSVDDNRLFEWVDGPLIQSMKEGGLFLADEISLADDSVLERLNSVLEPERTLVLAEKAGEGLEEFSNLEIIVAHKEFRLVGTMNPGGDYGKKELSPALRNRLTEIWCPKVDITRSASDVKLIISHNISKSIDLGHKIEDSIVYFLKYFTETELGKKITVSIRDILCWVLFINQAVTKSFPLDIGKAYVHGACLVILDGLGSGCTGGAVQNWKKMKEKALKCLCMQAQNMSQLSVSPSDFIVPETGTVRNDDFFARASGNNIVRINLSEQTDVSDLFGADLPVEGSEGGKFAWRDGPVLQAMKKGSWIVFDELNLASQSVLEGLNACFDHRGEIYIPELNKSFAVEHSLTKIFACQNPQFEGGARKGLPKSFLNRFTQVFVEPLSSFDLEFILRSVHTKIPYEIINKMVKFNEVLVEEILEKRKWGTKGGPWELNLRDLIRWCDVMVENQDVAISLNPGEYVEFIYADKMRTKSDREEIYRVYNNVFDTNRYPLYRKSGTFFISEGSLQAGRAVLQRKTSSIDIKFDDKTHSDLYVLHSQTPYLESLINCVNMNWMALLVGPSGEGKSSLVWLLSNLAGQRLETMSVNSHMDVTELLGGFEQADNKRQLLNLIDDIHNFLWQQIRTSLLNDEDFEKVTNLLNQWKNLCGVKDARIGRSTPEEVNQFFHICEAIQDLLKNLEKNFEKSCIDLQKRVESSATVSGGGTFEWVDSALVKAVCKGYWLLIDGVNLCSPSVLDRLNGLLEPGGTLVMNERGSVDSDVLTITPHPNFRLFLTMDPQHGEISRNFSKTGQRLKVKKFIETSLKSLKKFLVTKNPKNYNLMNMFSLNSKALQTSSVLGSPLQLAALVAMISANQKLPSLQFPNSLPKCLPRRINQGTALFFSFANIPLKYWTAFSIFLDHFHNKSKALITLSSHLSEKSSVAFQLLENITDSELPSDPRFNNTLLSSKIGYNDEEAVTSLANKALIGLWAKIFLSLDKLKTKKLRNKSSVEKSVYELSIGISKGVIGENKIYHPSLKYLSCLIKMITNLIMSLSEDTEINLDDHEYFNLRKALEWKRRLRTLCDQSVSKDNFHIFFPKLVFHWKNLHDHLLDQIPTSWNNLISQEMQQVVDQLKLAFSAHCSPLHQLIPEVRNNLGCPLPFTNRDSARAFEKLSEITELLIPQISYDNEKEIEKTIFLSSDKGSEVKRFLVNIAMDMSGSSNAEEYLIEIEELEDSVSHHLSLEYSKASTDSGIVHLWPIIDYFASRQLMMSTVLSQQGADLIKCKDILTKASSIPIMIFENPNVCSSLPAVALYMFNISNCSNLYPSKWLNFDPSSIRESKDENDIFPNWEGEQNFVLSQMGCNLTYHLLCGFSYNNLEMGFVSIENHSEKEIQLRQIRKTLWENWFTLSENSWQFETIFRNYIRRFVYNLMSSLSKTFKVDLKCESLDDLELSDVIEEFAASFEKKLGIECASILESMLEVKTAFESNDVLSIAKLGVFAGLLQSWLLSHIEPLDPAHERKIMLAYCNEELQETKGSLMFLKWLKILRYCHTSEGIHPHGFYYEKILNELKTKIQSLSQKVAHRPEPSQYSDIVQSISHFFKTVFLPSRIIDIVKELTTNSKSIITVRQHCEGTLRSCDIFIKKLLVSYPLYRDLITSLLHGVVIVCESVRILMFLTKNRELSMAVSKNLTQANEKKFDNVLLSVLNYPHERNVDNADKFLTKMVEDQECVTLLIKENSEKLNLYHQNQFLSLKASFYDLLNTIILHKFSKENYIFLKCIIEKVICWWRAQESEKKRKEKEEESLFIYKSRNLAVSETEEEEIHREYMELFPDFANEFSDLEYCTESDMEVDTENDIGVEVNSENIKLTDEFLEEVIEVHRLIVTNFTETSWIKGENNVHSKPLVPVTLRTIQVQNLLKTVGPFGTNRLDSSSLGSLILTNYMSSSLAQKSLKLTVVDKPFNYYNDPDLEEALKVKPLLKTLEKKCDELLEKWPSHPSLLIIQKVISRILNFSVTSPLIRLVIGLEAVLEKAQEWEKNAHKGVSLLQELTPITEQVIEWRKMELKAWNSCLDMITVKVYNEANKFWPHLYESLLSVTSDNVNDLIEALKNFMESSLVGDFKRRIEILKAFHCHLCVELKYCLDDKKEVLKTLVSITWNFYKFYLQFECLVEEHLRNEKNPIEKKVKEFIKIMRWNDLNFFAVRDSVIKSRRILHRYMRNWEKSLRQPLHPLLQDKSDETEKNKGEWDKEKITLSPLLKPVQIEYETLDPLLSSDGSHLNRLHSLTNKCFDLLCKTVDKMSYMESTEAVEEFTEDILMNFVSLVNSTEKAENIAGKEERIKALKDIVNRKKKSLSSLFKSLQHKGVSYTKGNSQWKEDFIDRCLTVPPMDLTVAFMKKDCEISKKCLHSCDKYFYKGIGRQALLLKSLHQAHKDVNTEDLKRLKGIASHFLILLQKLRMVIPNLCSEYLDIDCIVQEIDIAVRGYVPVQDEFRIWWRKIFCFMTNLALSLEEEIEVFSTFPVSDDSIIELQPRSHSFIEPEVLTVVDNLKNLFSEVSDLIAHSRNINKSLDNESFVKLPSLANIEELHVIVLRVSKIGEKLSECIKIFDKELKGTTTLSKQLIWWTVQWDDTLKNFLHWKMNLSSSTEVINCTFSSKAEACLFKLLKSVEELSKHHNKEISNKTPDIDAETKDMISIKLVNSLILDYECLRIDNIKRILLELTSELNNDKNTSLLLILKSMRPVLHYYLTMCRNILTSMAEGFRSLSKLHSSLLGIFQEIATKGFCKSHEIEEQDGSQEGATQFQDSGPGLSEGEGMKDVSERFESEDQLESALKEGEKEEEGNKNVREEKGVEISHDFEGALQDVDKEEEEDNKKEEEEEEEEDDDFDKQMGETEKGADKLDEKLWGEDEEEENEDGEKDDEKTEHGPGDSETTESQIVAKDDNKNKDENDDKEKKKKKELDVMEEDRRVSDEEEEEETYDDNFIDKYNKEKTDDQEEHKEMDLPEEINLDGDEKDESDAEENGDPDLNLEIEEQALFPEEEKESNEKSKENDDDGKENEECNNDDEKESEECNNNNLEEEEEKSDKGRQTVGEELKQEDTEEKEDNEQPSVSNDTEATKEAQSADMETKNSEKTSGEEPDEEMKQEEQGEMGEKTDDVTGVGQSDSKTKEESHIGETSALTNEDDSKQKMENQERPRRPGDPNQTKTLGEIEKKINHGLLTSKEKRYQDEEDKNSSEEKMENENKDPENKDSSLYEHIQKADDKFDKQMVDAGTKEEAKLVPAPIEEEEEINEEEPEGIVADLMELNEEEIVAAVFSEDLVTRRENIIEAEEGDTEKGSQQWEEIEGKVTSLALQLCEQLRLILEPTEAAKLRGDYRTGKRLNMKKVIPYIASQFRKDKIWLRRSQPSKRAYQVLLAVDDSESMSEVNAFNLARESIALVAKALTLLEVGQVGVISFGETTKILHPFHKPFSDLSGGKIFGNLTFSQSKSNFAQMLEDSVALLSGTGKSQNLSETAQLLLILSDGQTQARSKAVKAAVRAAREARIFIVFLVLDAHDNKYSFYDHLVYEDGVCKSMVETFPFPFFIVMIIISLFFNLASVTYLLIKNPSLW